MGATTEKKTLKELEDKHGEGKVKIVELSDAKGNTLEVFLKVPDRKVLGDFISWIDKDAYKAQNMAVNKCLLSHHEEVNANDEYFVACATAIGSLMPTGSYSIKN